MTQEDYPISDLDSLLSKDHITENDLQPIPELLLEEPKNSCIETPLTHDSENLSITPTDKPTTALSYRAKKRKSTAPSKQLFLKQKRSEEAAFRYCLTKNPKFQFILNYKVLENINQ